MDWNTIGSFLLGGNNFIGEVVTGVTKPDASTPGKVAAAAAGVNTEMIESLFGRVAIIVLGFIFVAAGLIMFRPDKILTEAVK